MPRHAYLIMAHKNFNQLRLLLVLLDHADNDIYVHIDKRAHNVPLEDIEACCKLSTLTIDRSVSVRWAAYSMIEAELLLLRIATQTPHMYYHLISGMDMPLKSQDEVHAFYNANEGIEFVAAKILTKPEVLVRLEYKAATHGLKGFTFHKGSQWFSITHKFALYIVDRAQFINNIFDHIKAADEIFVQSLLLNSSFREAWSGAREDAFPSQNMRLIEWVTKNNRESAHPRTFTMEDEAQLAASDCHFARKFDERTDARIITQLARRLVSSDFIPATLTAKAQVRKEPRSQRRPAPQRSARTAKPKPRVHLAVRRPAPRAGRRDPAR